MGGKTMGSNVIRLPPRSERKAWPSPDPERHPEVIAIPPRHMHVRRAVDMLKKMLRTIDENIYVHLAFPSEVKFFAFDEGMEFYDVTSTRPSGRAVDEALVDVEGWVKSWYFCVFKQQGSLVTRYIDREHPDVADNMRLASLEKVMDPDKADFDVFLAEIKKRS